MVGSFAEPIVWFAWADQLIYQMESGKLLLILINVPLHFNLLKLHIATYYIKRFSLSDAAFKKRKKQNTGNQSSHAKTNFDKNYIIFLIRQKATKQDAVILLKQMHSQPSGG